MYQDDEDALVDEPVRAVQAASPPREADAHFTSDASSDGAYDVRVVVPPLMTSLCVCVCVCVCACARTCVCKQ